MGRKNILHTGLVLLTALLFLFIATSCLTTQGPRAEKSPDRPIPERPLGKTGYNTTIFSLGGQATIERPGQDKKAHEIISRALDQGVNYIDTAPSYGNGISETYIGQALKGRRSEVFLATKSHDLTYEGTMRLVKESLARLQTDYIDLYQHHNISNDRRLNGILEEDGALKAFKELKEKGVVRFIGITGHSPRVLLKALELDVYDCILISINPAGTYISDWEYMEKLLNTAKEKGVGVIAMKVVGKGLLTNKLKMEDLMRYALSFPVSNAIIGISEPWQVDENAEIARNFKPMSEEERERIEQMFK